MLELYDCSPYSLPIQKIRLKAACGLSNADIKCLVWGEDALAFIHFVPTILFGLHLVVADEDLEKASNEIMRCLPYKIYTGTDRNSFISMQASRGHSRIPFTSSRQLPKTNATLMTQR